MEYVFPATFSKNTDASYTVTYVDLPGCISEGKSLGNAIDMAKSALEQWLTFLLEEGRGLPTASDIRSVSCAPDQFATLICAVVRNGRAVRRTVSLPEWIDSDASKAGMSLSKVLQEALQLKLERR